MDEIPDSVLESIFLCLGPWEVFGSISLVNKLFQRVAKDSYFLSVYIKTYFKLESSVKIPNPFPTLKQLLNKSSHYPIDFIGFGTTGGVDQDCPDWWVEMLFTMDSTGYCSRERQKNINTVGVLRKTQSILCEEKLHIVSLFNKNRTFQAFHGKLSACELSNPAILDVVIEFWGRNREQLMKSIKNAEEKQNQMAKISLILNELRTNEISLPRIRRREDDMNTLIRPIDFEGADSGKCVFISKEVIVSRNGMFTCPVETLMVFVSHVYVDIESPLFFEFNDILQPSHVDLLGYEANEIQYSNGNVYRTFKWTSAVLKPVLWAKFRKRSRKIQVELDEYFSGVYLYVKLLNPQDKRAEYGDPSAYCNLDCGFVSLIGREFHPIRIN